MPPLARLGDLALLLQVRDDAVEVVLLDAHLLGHLGDGDAGPRLAQPERLLGTVARALGPAATPGAARGLAGRRGALAARGGAVAVGLHAGQCARGGLQAVELVDGRPELLQAGVDLCALL